MATVTGLNTVARRPHRISPSHIRGTASEFLSRLLVRRVTASSSSWASSRRRLVIPRLSAFFDGRNHRCHPFVWIESPDEIKPQ